MEAAGVRLTEDQLVDLILLAAAREADAAGGDPSSDADGAASSTDGVRADGGDGSGVDGGGDDGGSGGRGGGVPRRLRALQRESLHLTPKSLSPP